MKLCVRNIASAAQGLAGWKKKGELLLTVLVRYGKARDTSRQACLSAPVSILSLEGRGGTW